MWAIATTLAFDEWFSGLSADGQAEVIAKVNLLKVLGPRLSRPHADTLKGSKHANMKELRANSGDSVLRVLFAFDPERTALLLIGGNKAGVSQKRFYRQMIAKTDELFDAHLRQLKSKREAK